MSPILPQVRRSVQAEMEKEVKAKVAKVENMVAVKAQAQAS